MLFEKEYYDRFEICNINNIHQFNINNQFIANFFLKSKQLNK